MPTIETVFPGNGAVGVPVGVQVIVIFDEEIDPTTVERAFIMTGPDTDRWTGAGLQLFDKPITPEPEFFLDSPDYTGVVQGTFTIEKIDALGSEITEPTYSYGGPVPYKSKLIFTPNDVLSATTTYEVIVSGDELDTDSIKVGIASRTVFDPQLGANLGDGEITVIGGYTGNISDTLVTRITVPGNIGTAKYEWYFSSDPLTIRTGTTSANEVLFDSGLYVTFGGDNFVTGDEFRVNVRPAAYMSGSSTFSFQTGSGSIVALPTDTSTTISVGSSSSTSTFSVLSTNPAHLDSFVPLDTDTITIIFSKAVDDTTITQDSVKVKVTPALGAYSGNSTSSLGEIPKSLTLSSDKKTLTIKI